jgi:hypothetical protein
MKHKVGDTVRIRSKEWMDAQGKDSDGDIIIMGNCLSRHVIEYAGQTARITYVDVEDKICKLNIDDGCYWWQDWVFDPDYSDDGPLDAEYAIRAMLDGETLYDKEGNPRKFTDAEIESFMSLSRSPPKRKRPMTRWEVLDWTNSEASRGWVVSHIAADMVLGWRPPQFFSYENDIVQYWRARLRPDLSGVDEDTIQGFEAEE